MKPNLRKQLTHLLCGICHELARQGRRVYFSTCDSIVQQLLRAKRDLELDRLLKNLSRFDALMIDDFGYVKQDRDEMEVLFTLLAHRYERGSADYQQSAVLEVGGYLQGPDDHGRCDRPPCAPQRRLGAECAQLPGRRGQKEKKTGQVVSRILPPIGGNPEGLIP